MFPCCAVPLLSCSPALLTSVPPLLSLKQLQPAKCSTGLLFQTSRWCQEDSAAWIVHGPVLTNTQTSTLIKTLTTLPPLPSMMGKMAHYFFLMRSKKRRERLKGQKPSVGGIGGVRLQIILNYGKFKGYE